MSQEELRERTKYLIEYYGSTQQFIATNIGVNRCTINLFLKGERNLALPIANKLETFLNERINPKYS